MSEFTVTASTGPRAAECIEHAITIARVTGSIGATHEIGEVDGTESSATVTRTVHAEFCGCADCAARRKR